MTQLGMRQPPDAPAQHRPPQATAGQLVATATAGQLVATATASANRPASPRHRSPNPPANPHSDGKLQKIVGGDRPIGVALTPDGASAGKFQPVDRPQQPRQAQPASRLRRLPQAPTGQPLPNGHRDP